MVAERHESHTTVQRITACSGLSTVCSRHVGSGEGRPKVKPLKHAQDMMEHLNRGSCHLSPNMCPRQCNRVIVEHLLPEWLRRRDFNSVAIVARVTDLRNCLLIISLLTAERTVKREQRIPEDISSAAYIGAVESAGNTRQHTHQISDQSILVNENSLLFDGMHIPVAVGGCGCSGHLPNGARDRRIRVRARRRAVRSCGALLVMASLVQYSLAAGFEVRMISTVKYTKYAAFLLCDDVRERQGFCPRDTPSFCSCVSCFVLYQEKKSRSQIECTRT